MAVMAIMETTGLTAMASSRARARRPENMLSSSNELYGRTAAVVLLVIYTTPIVAGNLDITPRIRVGAIYTDNLRLDPSNEEHDAAAELTPGISIRADGNRLDASLDYQMQNFTFLKNSNANNTAHQLNATAAAELAKNFLFLDARSAVGQAVVDADERISLNNFNTSGNRTDFYSYTLSPYLQNHFGGYANGILRYTHSQLAYDEGPSDSIRNGVDASLVSGRRFKQVSWFANYSYNNIDYDDSSRQNDRFENANGEIRHGLSKDFSLVAQAGRSNDDLQSSRDVETGTYWAVGGFWQSSRFWSLEALSGKNLTTASVGLYPTVRTSLLVNYRDRDVGLNPGERWTVDFDHRSRRTVWNARYFEDTTTEQQRRRETINTFFGVDPITGENPDPQPGDVSVPVQTEIISLSDEVEERKRASGTFGMNTGRSGVRVTIFHETREGLDSREEEKTQGARGSWNRRLASRTNSILTGSFQRITGDDRDDRDFWYINASLIRRISRKLTGTLDYRFTRQDSDNDQNDYDENHVIARLTATF
jgi:uncharacterized protein (PEP-CTERM system associated)